jgi:hypothetical protein
MDRDLGNLFCLLSSPEIWLMIIEDRGDGNFVILESGGWKNHMQYLRGRCLKLYDFFVIFCYGSSMLLNGGIWYRWGENLPLRVEKVASMRCRWRTRRKEKSCPYPGSCKRQPIAEKTPRKMLRGKKRNYHHRCPDRKERLPESSSWLRGGGKGRREAQTKA